jgi:hypothetical protein
MPNGLRVFLFYWFAGNLHGAATVFAILVSNFLDFLAEITKNQMLP